MLPGLELFRRSHTLKELDGASLTETVLFSENHSVTVENRSDAIVKLRAGLFSIPKIFAEDTTDFVEGAPSDPYLFMDDKVSSGQGFKELARER